MLAKIEKESTDMTTSVWERKHRIGHISFNLFDQMPKTFHRLISLNSKHSTQCIFQLWKVKMISLCTVCQVDYSPRLVTKSQK